MKKPTTRKVKRTILITAGTFVALPLLPVAIWPLLWILLVWLISVPFSARGLSDAERASRMREKRKVLVWAPRAV